MQSSHLITSYAVPPQSSFPCPPCSIRLKKDGKSSPVRLTYCVLQRPEVQLQVFTEEDGGYGTSKITTSAFTLNGAQSPVVVLETIPLPHASAGQVPCDLIVVHQDGTIRRIAGDLSQQRSLMKTSDVSNATTSTLTVRTACWMSEEQAKGSILKNRPDLYLGRDGGSLGLLVMVMTRSVASNEGADDVTFGIWPVDERHLPNAFSSNMVCAAAPLIIHTLPDTEWKKNNTVQYSFNSVNGVLSVAFSRGLKTYDLSTYTPEISSQLSLNTIAGSYPMSLTPSLVVGSTSSAVNLYDTKYHSIQSTVNLEQPGCGLKRKRSGNGNDNPIRFVTYFAKIKRFVACRGHALIAFDMKASGVQDKHDTLYRNSMLVKAVGRGMQSQTTHHVKHLHPPFLESAAVSRSIHHDNASWASQQQRLDELAEKGYTTAFDELMAKELCNSDGELLDDEPIQLPRSPLHVDQAKIDYLISKIFEPLSEPDRGMGESADFGNSLKVVFHTPRLIHWLIRTGQLTDRRVERALQHTRSSQTFMIRPGAVVLALARSKGSYEMVIYYFRHTSPIPLSNVLRAIKLLLGDVVANAARIVPPRLLEDGYGGHIMSLSEGADTNHQGDDAGCIEHRVPPVNPPTDGTTEPSSSSLALLIGLEAFGSFLSQDIATALRSQLSQSEILSIIQVLRQQLFHSGHTSYLPAPPSSARATPNLSNTRVGGASLSLDSILKLLSSCLDAIGPVGFLGQTDNDDFLGKLIPDLKSEISFAFEGMQETNHLQGLLREVLRYADSTMKGNDSHTIHSTPKLSLLDGQQKPGTIVTLYTEPRADQGDVEGGGGLLPLSLRADNAISSTKVRKGGGQVLKRSKRDIRKLQDRSVGNYSFERLLL